MSENDKYIPAPAGYIAHTFYAADDLISEAVVAWRITEYGDCFPVTVGANDGDAFEAKEDLICPWAVEAPGGTVKAYGTTYRCLKDWCEAAEEKSDRELDARDREKLLKTVRGYVAMHGRPVARELFARVSGVKEVHECPVEKIHDVLRAMHETVRIFPTRAKAEAFTLKGGPGSRVAEQGASFVGYCALAEETA